MANALVNRLKLVLEMKSCELQKLRATPFKLIRPTSTSVNSLDEYYGLNSYTDKKIHLKFIEGNHESIIESQDLIEELNL